MFLGLSALTVTFLRGDGIAVPMLAEIRAALLVGAGLWSIRLAWSVAGLHASPLRQAVAAACIAVAAALSAANWVLLFWVW